MREITTIQLSKTTAKKLKELGGKRDTYEDIILKLMDELKKEGTVVE